MRPPKFSIDWSHIQNIFYEKGHTSRMFVLQTAAHIRNNGPISLVNYKLVALALIMTEYFVELILRIMKKKGYTVL